MKCSTLILDVDRTSRNTRFSGDNGHKNRREVETSKKIRTWKLKWFSEETLLKFVAVVRALHLERVNSPLPVHYIPWCVFIGAILQSISFILSGIIFPNFVYSCMHVRPLFYLFLPICKFCLYYFEWVFVQDVKMYLTISVNLVLVISRLKLWELGLLLAS